MLGYSTPFRDLSSPSVFFLTFFLGGPAFGLRLCAANFLMYPTDPHWTAVGKGIEGVHGLTVVKQVSRWSRRRANARLEARYMREAHAAQWWARPAP